MTTPIWVIDEETGAPLQLYADISASGRTARVERCRASGYATRLGVDQWWPSYEDAAKVARALATGRVARARLELELAQERLARLA